MISQYNIRNKVLRFKFGKCRVRWYSLLSFESRSTLPNERYTRPVFGFPTPFYNMVWYPCETDDYDLETRLLHFNAGPRLAFTFYTVYSPRVMDNSIHFEPGYFRVNRDRLFSIDWGGKWAATPTFISRRGPSTPCWSCVCLGEPRRPKMSIHQFVVSTASVKGCNCHVIGTSLHFREFWCR